MNLLLKRNEKPGALGTRYDLFAKLELKPEEEALIRKGNPAKMLVWEDDPRRAQFRWRLCLIPGGIAAVILGMIAAAVFHMFLGLPVMIFSPDYS
jgi:hypothetical protein